MSRLECNYNLQIHAGQGAESSEFSSNACRTMEALDPMKVIGSLLELVVGILGRIYG